MVTFWGKLLTKIVPFKKKNQLVEKNEVSIFGLWKDHDRLDSVEEYVRDIKKGRPK